MTQIRQISRINTKLPDFYDKSQRVAKNIAGSCFVFSTWISSMQPNLAKLFLDDRHFGYISNYFLKTLIYKSKCQHKDMGLSQMLLSKRPMEGQKDLPTCPPKCIFFHFLLLSSSMFRLSFPQGQHHHQQQPGSHVTNNTTTKIPPCNGGFYWTFLGEKLTQYQPFFNWQNIAKKRD